MSPTSHGWSRTGLLFLCLITFGPLLAQMPILEQKYRLREVQAPPELRQTLENLRIEGRQKNWTFQVGNTSVARFINLDITAITGATLPTPVNAPPSGQLSPTGGLATGLNAASTSLDLRDHRYLTPVRDQGGCGSCWAFCSTAALETAHIIRNGENPAGMDLAEQYVLSCSAAGSCGGGQPHQVFEHLKSTGRGLPREGDQSYTGTDQACPATPSFTAYRVDNWGWVGSNRENPTVPEIKNAIATYGAVEGYVYVNSAFAAYTSGVINDNSRTGWGGWHCVQIVGWDDARQAYLIKNSWGLDWGMAGFGWVRYNVLDVGDWASWVTAKPVEKTDLTGYYSCNDGGHYYIRQSGSTVFWFGEHPGGGWANVFRGRLTGSTLRGQYYDVPKGAAKGQGALTLTVSNAGRDLRLQSGSFGGSTWSKTTLPATLPGVRAAGFEATGNAQNLDGRWTCNDGGNYYVRQLGNTVVWFGEGGLNGSGKPAFANVGVGTRNGNSVTLDWADVAKCRMQGRGTLTLSVSGSDIIVRTAGTGFGGSRWSRPAAASSLAGTWTNRDAGTRGITRLVIPTSTTSIQTYGACLPTDCDWGSTALRQSGDTYQAIYDQGFSKRYLTVTPVAGNQLKLVIRATYRDKRPDRTDTEYFTLAKK